MLVGLAIDVSASMRTSIANETDGDLSRLDSLRGAIRDVARQARSTFGPGDAGPGAILNVFAYAFGLTHLPVAVCDFLSLSKAASRFHLAGETPAQHAATWTCTRPSETSPRNTVAQAGVSGSLVI